MIKSKTVSESWKFEVTLMGSTFSNLFLAEFLFTFTFCEFVHFEPPENDCFTQQILKLTAYSYTLTFSPLPYQIIDLYLL